MHILHTRLLDIVKNFYPVTIGTNTLSFATPPKAELGDIAI